MTPRLLCLAFLLVLTCHSSTVHSTSWWNLGVETCSVSGDACRNCAVLESNGILTNGQSELCSDSSDTLKPIARGTRQGIITCQEQFENRTWNCPTFQGENLFGRFLNDRVRETATVFALTTAGAISALGQDCHERRLKDCPCIFDFSNGVTFSYIDEEGNTILKDCEANYAWAYNHFLPFLANANGSDSNSLEAAVDMHNIEVGAKAVKNLEQECTCHGVSGTCTTQTCYNKIPDVRVIGEYFLGKYDGAVQVDFDGDGNLIRVGNPNADPLKDDDFVFIAPSPNLCEPDPEEGVSGTSGRECDRSPGSTKRCGVLCCGRGSYTQTIIIPKRECRFVSRPVFDIVCSITGNDTVVKELCN